MSLKKNHQARIMGLSALVGVLLLAQGASWGAPIIATEGIQIDGGTPATGRIYKSSQVGLGAWSQSGSIYDFGIFAVGGADMFAIPAGTNNLVVGSSSGTTTFPGGLKISGGSLTQGSLAKDATYGLAMQGAVGSQYEYSLFSSSGNAIFRLPNGTNNLQFSHPVNFLHDVNISNYLTNTLLAGSGTRLVTANTAGRLGNETSIAGNYSWTGSATFGNGVFTGRLDVADIMFDNARNAYLTGSAQPGIYGTNETGSAWPFNWNNHLVIQGRSDAARDILFVTGSSPALRYQITGTGEHNFMGRVAMSMNPASGGLSLRNGNDRWQFYLSGAETGSNNAGSSFSLAAYTDAGGFIDNPILIARASAGTMTLSRPVKISTNGTVSSQLDLNGSGGTSPGFSISRGASTRWVMLSEFGAEGGGNTGSDFSIRAYNDAGTAYDTPLSIARAPGGPVTFSRPVTFNSGLGTSGLVTASSGISIEGGTPGIGRITRNTANGLQMWLPSGTDYNFIMSAPGGQDLIYNRAGGTQVEFPASGGVSVAGPLQVTNFVGSNYTLSHNDFWKMYMSNGSNDAGALHIRTGDNGDEPIYFEQVNGETPNVRMVINGSGNVGIGTQDVGSFRARVAGDVRLGNVATIGRSGSHYDEFGFNVGFTNTSNQYTYVNTDPAASIRMGYQGSIEFRTAPQGTGGTSLSLNRRMVITEAGNVGIGTSGEPAAKLHVDGDAILSDWKFRQSMTPYNFSVGAVLHNKLYPGTYDYALGQFDHTGETVLNSPYKVSIGTKGTAYVKISESEVTIDHGVTVNGTLQANVLAAGTVKATAWEIAEVPDYVFEKGYKLASLEKVESFVKENKHLPEIPSAKEMKRDGLDLVKMNFDLLKKVEELTLYAIEQNKVTRAQERRSRDLEKEILELKKTLASMTKSGN